jgi:hypothetical protein
MPFGGTPAVFSLTYSFTTEAAAPPIEIAKLDTQFQDIATALSACILRDGTGLPTATIPFNGQRISGLGNATADADALNRQTGDGRYARLAAANVFTFRQQITLSSEALTLVPLADSVAHWVQWYQSNGTTPRAYIGFGSNNDHFTLVNQVAGGNIAFTTSGGSFTYNGNAVLVNAGTFADARVAQSNVTQHQAALSIAWGQLTSVPATFTPAAHNHSAAELTSGTIPDARFPGTLPAINGSALTNLNGSAVASGTVAAARLPKIGSLTGITIQADPGGTPSGAAGDMFFYY